MAKHSKAPTSDRYPAVEVRPRGRSFADLAHSFPAPELVTISVRVPKSVAAEIRSLIPEWRERARQAGANAERVQAASVTRDLLVGALRQLREEREGFEAIPPARGVRAKAEK